MHSKQPSLRARKFMIAIAALKDAIYNRMLAPIVALSVMMTLGVAAPASAIPPVRCNLTNNFETSIATPVGEIRGLQDIGIIIVVVMIAVAVLVGAIPTLRRKALSGAGAVIAIMIGGSIVIGALLIIVPPQC